MVFAKIRHLLIKVNAYLIVVDELWGLVFSIWERNKFHIKAIFTKRD